MSTVDQLAQYAYTLSQHQYDASDESVSSSSDPPRPSASSSRMQESDIGRSPNTQNKKKQQFSK